MSERQTYQPPAVESVEFMIPKAIQMGEHRVARLLTPQRVEYTYLGTEQFDQVDVGTALSPRYLAYVTSCAGQSLGEGGLRTLHTNLSLPAASRFPQDAIDHDDFLHAAHNLLMESAPYSYYQERFATHNEAEFESRIAQVAGRARMLGFDSRAPIVAQMPVYQGGTIVGLEGAACFPNSFPQD